LVLEAQAVTRFYGPVAANNGVDFDLRAGEIHALLGENGAGKSTLLRILAGLERPDSGTVIGPSFRDIGLVHQHFQLFDRATVAENVAVGREVHRGPRYARRDTEAQVEALARSLGMDLDPRARVADLPLGQKQQVEILRLLWRDVKILLLDEPTAVLTPTEAQGLLVRLRQLADQGRTVVLVTHKLSEIAGVADRTTVLRDGRVVGRRSRGEATTEELAHLMVGRGFEIPTLETVTPGPEALEARSPWWTLKVRSGEILGVAGVAGNGQDSLEDAAFGRGLPGWSLASAPGGSLAVIPSDRNDRGSASAALIAESALWGHEDHLPGPWLTGRTRDTTVAPWLQAFDVRGPGLRGRTGALSGGNLQKLIVARELARGASALVAAEPTRGVDPGAAATVHRALVDFRAAGGAVLLISSDLTEVQRLSDRVAVLYRGRLAGILNRSEATDEALGRLMAGLGQEGLDG